MWRRMAKKLFLNLYVSSSADEEGVPWRSGLESRSSRKSTKTGEMFVQISSFCFDALRAHIESDGGPSLKMFYRTAEWVPVHCDFAIRFAVWFAIRFADCIDRRHSARFVCRSMRSALA